MYSQTGAILHENLYQAQPGTAQMTRLPWSFFSSRGQKNMVPVNAGSDACASNDRNKPEYPLASFIPQHQIKD